MSSREFAEWIVFYAFEPFGEERADLRAAIVAKIVADVNTPKGKARMRLEDFLPKFGPKEPQTWQEQLSIVEMWNVAFKGVDKRSVYGHDPDDPAGEAGS